MQEPVRSQAGWGDRTAGGPAHAQKHGGGEGRDGGAGRKWPGRTGTGGCVTGVNVDTGRYPAGGMADQEGPFRAFSAAWLAELDPAPGA